MSDLAEFLLKQAKDALRSEDFDTAEELIKRARRHDRSIRPPKTQMARLYMEMFLENPDNPPDLFARERRIVRDVLGGNDLLT